MAENGDSEEFTFTAGGEDGYQDDDALALGGEETESPSAGGGGGGEGGEGGSGEAGEEGEEAGTDLATEESGAAADESGVEDPELEAIKARVREMEEEAEKLKEMQSEVEKQMNLSASSISSPPKFPTLEEKVDIDGRSVYVGNVDYGATAEELEAHFHGCGSINRVTILCDKFTGHPKGFAYVEFADKDSIVTAQALDDSLFRGRQIKVTPKRTNKPGVSTTDRPPRGGRGRGRFGRGAAAAYTPYYGGYAPAYVPRPRGRFRPRRAMYYSPY